MLLLPLMLAFAPPMSSLAPLAAEPPCGEDQAQAVEFSLEDVNPSSPSFGQTLGPQDFSDKVVVVYFASATCGVCQSHVRALGEIVQEQAWPDVQVLVVNLAPYAAYAEDLSSLTDLPVLQDTAEVDAEDSYGASKWYIYWLRPGGTLDHMRYTLAIDGSERERFVSETEALR